MNCINKWLAAFQAVAIIVGVGVAIWQLNEIFTQTQIQSQTLKATQITESAKLVLELATKIEGSEYKKVTSAIQEHDQKHPLLFRSKGPFRDTEIEAYIGNFEDIGLLVQENLILGSMAVAYPVVPGSSFLQFWPSRPDGSSRRRPIGVVRPFGDQGCSPFSTAFKSPTGPAVAGTWDNGISLPWRIVIFHTTSKRHGAMEMFSKLLPVLGRQTKALLPR